MTVGILGPTTVEIDHSVVPLSPRDRLVLAVLALRQGHVVQPDTIADALWGEDVPATWTKVVQGCVARLRKVLGAEAIETHPHGYRLAVDPGTVDAERFERELHRAQELLALQEPDRAAYILDEALALWRGAPALDLEDWDAARAERHRLAELRMEGEELRLEAALASGRYREVLTEARVRVEEQPLRERRWGLLAQALYQAGRQADALSTLRRARKVLLDELGLDPGPDLVALEQAVLRQDPSLAVDEPGSVSPVCPYPGLVPFDVDDGDSFFGRETEIEDCLRRVARDGVLAVVGASGSGKSSLVRAGVAADLGRRGLRTVVITPGAHPVSALAAVPGGPARTALIVDQCEEVFTLCEDRQERAEFLAAVAGHQAHGPVVVALRADRMGELAGHPEFAALVERGLYLLTSMGPDQLRAAVEIPARQAGLRLEHGLVDLVLRDAEGEPGSLPLMAHALRQTWFVREGGTLTVAGYAACGGIRGAVARSAEDVYARVPEQERSGLRDLLLRLVTPVPEGDPVRSRLPRRVVAPDAPRDELVERLVAARLLTSDEGVVEIAHEALIRAWPRLQTWLADDVEGQLVWQHLAVAARSWAELGRPDSELYRGLRLGRAAEWAARGEHELTPDERAFLDASLAVRRAEEERGAVEARRQRAANRRLRLMVAAVAVLALVASSLGTAALLQARRADREAEAARAQAQVARTQEIASAAVATISEDPGLASALAVVAASAAPDDVATMSALHRTAGSGVVQRVSGGFGWGEMSAQLDATGSRAVLGSLRPGDAGRQIEVLDVGTDEVLWSYSIPDEPGREHARISGARFTPDGRLLVAGVSWVPQAIPRTTVGDGPAAPEAGVVGVLVWDAETYELRELLETGACGGGILDISDRYALVAGSSAPDCAWEPPMSLTLVDLAAGMSRTLSEQEGVAPGVRPAALSMDGTRVAFLEASTERSHVDVVVQDTDDGSEAGRISLSTADAAPDVWDLSSNGSLVVLKIQPLEVWDVAKNRLLTSYWGHGTVARGVRFADDDTVFSSGDDASVRRWDPISGSELAVYPAAGAGDLSISAAGPVAVFGSNSMSAAVLDPGRSGDGLTVPTCPGFLPSSNMTSDGSRLIFGITCNDTAESRRTTYFTADLPGLNVTEIGHDGDLNTFALSPDGERLVYSHAPDRIMEGLRVVKIATGGTATTLEGFCPADMDALPPKDCSPFPATPFTAAPWMADWSPDGSMIVASMQREPGVAVWDSDDGRLLWTGHAQESEEGERWGWPSSASFSADGTELLITTERGVVVRSSRTWEVVRSGAALAVPGGDSTYIVGQRPDAGELVLAAPFPAQGSSLSGLVVVDSDTLEVTRSRGGLHPGFMRSVAISPDLSRVATGGSEGNVRIWDVGTLTLVHEVPGTVSVQALAWVDDDRLAVGAQGGVVRVVPVDNALVLAEARAGLTRGLTSGECREHFPAERCPTLGELRAEPAGQAPLQGTWAVDWSGPQEVADVLHARAEAHDQAPLADSAVADLPLWAADVIGPDATTLALDLQPTRWTLRRTGLDAPLCEGSWAALSGRLRLSSERGTWCLPHLYLEASYRLEGDTLRLVREGLRGDIMDDVLLTTKPLQRQDGDSTTGR